MAKIVCALYEDPVTGYACNDIPDIERYSGGQTTPAVRVKTTQGSGESTDR
jgi:hypothetical protein